MEFFEFLLLPREIRLEVLQHSSIQTLGRFIQTNSTSDSLINKDIWHRKIDEINPSIWGALKKATRRGDIKLLCAIVVASTHPTEHCSCHWSMSDKQWLKLDFLFHLDKLFSVPAQNALLSYLLTYSRHGSFGAAELNKSIGMRSGNVLLTHRKILPWMAKNFGRSRHSLRLFLHGYFMVTYCFGLRWKVDPLFVRNQLVFSSLVLRDADSNIIPFTPKIKATKHGNKVDTKQKYYSIEEIKKLNLTCYLNGEQISPNDLYYLFDYARILNSRDRPCNSYNRIPKAIQEWLVAKASGTLTYK